MAEPRVDQGAAAVTHDYHEDLPGYAPAQLLHAGCGECDARSREPGGGLAHLDRTRFVFAWFRASVWKHDNANLPDLNPAEVPLLGALWAVQCQLEQFGVPIGAFPVARPQPR